ncbi:MAG: hypothetical protein GDA56_05955 [Hormoscilla sp. GM7CHS1pb]|nr:hypothetical protein [Hormoscilla sp. GM7CHS1pb]
MNREFQPLEILYLESGGARLYAEVIQIVKSRQLAWVRPLMLADASLNPSETPTLYDMRNGADLLWPIALFRPALDTEVIPLLVQLEVHQTDKLGPPPAAQQLRAFVEQVWLDHQKVFQ